jgi:hypothetical protein
MAANNALPEDPVSQILAMAIMHHEMFSAYMDAGFSRHEAFELVKVNVCAYIAAAAQPTTQGDANEND